MKKIFLALAFVAGGCAFWWVISNNTRYPIRASDVELQSLMQLSLSNLGVQDKDVVSRLNEIKKDDSGSYVYQTIKLKIDDARKIDTLAQDMEKSGATVKRLEEKGRTILQLSKDNRLLGEISIQR